MRKKTSRYKLIRPQGIKFPEFSIWDTEAREVVFKDVDGTRANREFQRLKRKEHTL